MTCRLRWCVEMETRWRIPIWRTFGRIQWHVIPEPRITLQGAATWWIHCDDSRTTCRIAGCKNSIRHIENRFGPYFIFICNAVKALTNGGFPLVSSPIDLFVTAVSAQCGAMWHVNFHKHVSDASLNDTVLVPVTGSWLLRHTRPIPRHTTTTTFVTVFEKKNNELRTASETAEIKLWWSSRYYL